MEFVLCNKVTYTKFRIWIVSFLIKHFVSHYFCHHREVQKIEHSHAQKQ